MAAHSRWIKRHYHCKHRPQQPGHRNKQSARSMQQGRAATWRRPSMQAARPSSGFSLDGPHTYSEQPQNSCPDRKAPQAGLACSCWMPCSAGGCKGPSGGVTGVHHLPGGRPPKHCLNVEGRQIGMVIAVQVCEEDLRMWIQLSEAASGCASAAERMQSQCCCDAQAAVGHALMHTAAACGGTALRRVAREQGPKQMGSSTFVRLAAGTPVATRFTYEPVPMSHMNLSPLPSSMRKLEATCCRLTSGVPLPSVVILHRHINRLIAE